jgi:glyoxylase-like metal-dependent hydrolase (beta-lactamase superfamily II)
MTITTFENGPFGVNSYILTENGRTLIIDPGADILDADFPSDPEAALITHAHIDHVEGVNPLRNKFPGIRMMISSDGNAILGDIHRQARMFGLHDPGPVTADDIIDPGKEFEVCGMRLLPIPTPGHCPGSVSFLIGNSCFTGDALFRGTIGRADLPGGDAALLIESITEKLLSLPDDTVVYPGHGPSSTIGYEKKTNPWLRGR